MTDLVLCLCWTIAAAGWKLAVEDDGSPLGNGAFGAVFRGTATFGSLRVPVAVKQFFMLVNPKLYGLATETDVSNWVQRELVPEINTLIGLVRCGALRTTNHDVAQLASLCI